MDFNISLTSFYKSLTKVPAFAWYVCRKHPGLWKSNLPNYLLNTTT